MKDETAVLSAWSRAIVAICALVFAGELSVYAQSFCSRGSGSEGDCFECCDACSGYYQFGYGVCDNGATCDTMDCVSKEMVNNVCNHICCETQSWYCYDCISEGNYCNQQSGTPCCSGLWCTADWCQPI
jgi:hypothetical protein